MKYLFDTDHISILQARTGAEFTSIVGHLKKVVQSDVCVSVVSFHEQVIGCHSFINRNRKQDEIIRGYSMLDQVLRSYSAISVLPYERFAASEFDRLRAGGVRIGTMDLRIAVNAIGEVVGKTTNEDILDAIFSQFCIGK